MLAAEIKGQSAAQAQAETKVAFLCKFLQTGQSRPEKNGQRPGKVGQSTWHIQNWGLRLPVVAP